MKTSRIESPELDFFAFLVGHLYESFRYPPLFSNQWYWLKNEALQGVVRNLGWCPNLTCCWSLNSDFPYRKIMGVVQVRDFPKYWEIYVQVSSSSHFESRVKNSSQNLTLLTSRTWKNRLNCSGGRKAVPVENWKCFPGKWPKFITQTPPRDPASSACAISRWASWGIWDEDHVYHFHLPYCDDSRLWFQIGPSKFGSMRSIPTIIFRLNGRFATATSY